MLPRAFVDRIDVLGFSKPTPTNEKMEVLHKSKTNGYNPTTTTTTNGVLVPSDEDSFSQFHSATSSVIYSPEANSVQMTIAHARKRMTTELVVVDDAFLNEMSIEVFIDFLNKERLTSMPHRGSRWDKALRSAEYFALQISSYAELLEEFTPNSLAGVNIGLASCRLLLQVSKAPQEYTGANVRIAGTGTGAGIGSVFRRAEQNRSVLEVPHQARALCH